MSAVSNLCQVALTFSYGIPGANSPIFYNLINASSPYIVYNVNNGIFNVTVAGWYLFSFSCQLGGVTFANINTLNSAFYYFYVNGSRYSTGWESNGTSSVPGNGNPSTLTFNFLESAHFAAGSSFYCGFSTAISNQVFYNSSFPASPTMASIFLLSQDSASQSGFIGGNFEGSPDMCTLASRSSGNTYSYSPNGSTAIVFNTVFNSSPYCSYNTSTGVFTINQDGMYLVTILIELTSYPASGSPSIFLQCNGIAVSGTYSNSQDSAGNSLYCFKCAFVDSLPAGQTLYCFLQGSPVNLVNINGNSNSTRMAVTKIG